MGGDGKLYFYYQAGEVQLMQIVADRWRADTRQMVDIHLAMLLCYVMG